MNWLALNRLLARVLLHGTFSRLLLAGLSLGAAIAATMILELTTGKEAIEAFVIVLLDYQEFDLTAPVLFLVSLIGAVGLLASAFHRYRTRLLQTALGRLYVDGRIEGATLQRAIRLQRYADEGEEERCTLDVVEALFPTTPLPSGNALQEWFDNAAPLGVDLPHHEEPRTKNQEPPPY